MHKPRQRTRVARVLSYGKSHGTKWKRFNGCIIAGSLLLLASVAFLQLRLAIGRNHPSSDVGDESEGLSVNYNYDGRSWKGLLWQGGAVKEGWQRMERKLGNPGSGSVRGMGGHRIESEGASSEAENGIPEEDEGELENEMDMEDEDGDEEEDESFDGDAGELHHDRFSRGLQEENNGLGVRMPQQNRELMAMGDGGFSKEDHSIGVFSTDDEPQDEETRDRVEHMSNIEDVLMLNRVDSPAKKDSWGRIQDELFLKKEKGEKLSSDPLNPENNLLLQDPDSVGLDGSLTMNDRALRKAFKWGGLATESFLIDESVHRLGGSQNKPDVRVEDDKKEETKVQSLNRGAGGHKVLATEVRVLDEGRMRNMSEEHDPLKGESDLSQSRENNGEAFSETSPALPKRRELQRATHKKKERKKVQKMSSKDDMMGWGRYYPGFLSELTFSDFMEKFLFDDKCSVRVFMAWMTPPWAFTVRHQRVLESLLYFHPTACVVVFSETLELDFFESFVEEGYRIATVMPDVEELLRDTPTDVFATILPDWRKVELFYVHYTELLRLSALYKYGGTYLDFDMIVLKPLTHLSNTIGSELLGNGQLRPHGAIMIFERFSPFLNKSMAQFTATYDETLRDWNGAALLDRVMKAPTDADGVILVAADMPHVEPPIFFFPLSSQSIRRYFTAPEEDVVIAEELELFNKILLDSFTVHLWNGLTFNIIPEPGSLIEKLMERHCLHCTDIL